MFPEVSVSALTWHIKHCERQTAKKRSVWGTETTNKTGTQTIFFATLTEEKPDQLESWSTEKDSQKNSGYSICLQTILPSFVILL